MSPSILAGTALVDVRPRRLRRGEPGSFINFKTRNRFISIKGPKGT